MLPSRSKSLSGPGPSAGPKGPVLIEGLLEKKKKTFGSSKFFCSLRDGKLWYSEDKGRESIIDISHAQSVREGKAKFSFEIITSSRTHTFVADSLSTRDKWVTSLREAMRVSSRKNSTLSYIESANSDDEMGAAASDLRASVASQRASGVKSPTTSPLNPRFGESLPVGLTKRTTPSIPPPSVKEETTYAGRSSELNPVMSSVCTKEEEVQTKPSVECTALALETPSKDEGSRVTSGLLSDGGAKNEIREEEAEEECVAAQSRHDTASRDGERETMRTSSGATSEATDDHREKRATTTRHFSGETDESDSRVVPETVSTSPNSLYANSADIKKFLNEQSAQEEEEEEEERAVSVRTSAEDTERETKRKKDSSNETESQSPRDATTEKKEADEEADDVFSPPSIQVERRENMDAPIPPPVVMSVLRRPSHPVIPVFVDPPEETEPAAVELDTDFCRDPIPDLPHAALKETWSSAFAEMRAILSAANSTAALKEPSALTHVFKEQPGCAVDSLKHFLKSIECG